MSKDQRKKLFLAVKILISVGLAGIVYLTVDKKGLLQAIKSFSLTGIFSLLILYTLGQILSAYKWQIFVKEIGIRKSRLEIIRAYFFGMFVNVFGFGTVGGDIVRGLALAPPKGTRAATLATVIADRVHGLIMLLAIGTLTISIFRPQALGNIVPLFSLGGIAGLCLLAAFWWFGPNLLNKFFPTHHKWSATLNKITSAFPRRKKPLIKASAASFAFHSLQLFMHIIIAGQLNSQLSVAYLLATVPFVNIVSSLPISFFNGLGVREAMYCMLLMPAGSTQEEAVAFGAVWLFIVTIVSSFGVFLLTPDMKQAVKDAKSNVTRREIEQEDVANPIITKKRAVG